MDSSIGVIIGVIVLLVSIGFVVLMMVTEWSSAPSVSAEQAESVPPKTVRSTRPAASKKKAAPSKKPAKKKPSKKTKSK